MLSVEIMIKILHPANVGYKKRVTFFHVLVWILAGFMLGYSILMGKPGVSELGTCLIKGGSEAE